MAQVRWHHTHLLTDLLTYTQADGSAQMAYEEFMLSALRDALAGAATQVASQLDLT